MGVGSSSSSGEEVEEDEVGALPPALASLRSKLLVKMRDTQKVSLASPSTAAGSPPPPRAVSSSRATTDIPVTALPTSPSLIPRLPLELLDLIVSFLVVGLERDEDLIGDMIDFERIEAARTLSLVCRRLHLVGRRLLWLKVDTTLFRSTLGCDEKLEVVGPLIQQVVLRQPTGSQQDREHLRRLDRLLPNVDTLFLSDFDPFWQVVIGGQVFRNIKRLLCDVSYDSLSLFNLGAFLAKSAGFPQLRHLDHTISVEQLSWDRWNVNKDDNATQPRPALQHLRLDLAARLPDPLPETDLLLDLRRLFDLSSLAHLYLCTYATAAALEGLLSPPSLPPLPLQTLHLRLTAQTRTNFLPTLTALLPSLSSLRTLELVTMPIRSSSSIFAPDLDLVVSFFAALPASLRHGKTDFGRGRRVEDVVEAFLQKHLEGSLEIWLESGREDRQSGRCELMCWEKEPGDDGKEAWARSVEAE